MGGGFGDSIQDNGTVIEGKWRAQSQSNGQIAPLKTTRARNTSLQAKKISLHLMRYFETMWQVQGQ